MDHWNKYLKKHDNGHVGWSLEGFQMLNELPVYCEVEDGDLGARGILGSVLMSRGFKNVSSDYDPYSKYELSDGEGRFVGVLMDSEALRVVRDGLMYKFPMHYAQGQDELCDLWEMVRKAWNA